MFANVNTVNPDSQRYGYLDLQGHEVIAPQYEDAGDFHEGKAVVKLKKKSYSLIDRDGARLSSYPYAYVGALGDGLLPFQKESSGKFGYINERGKIIISPQYRTALPFEDKRAIVDISEDYTSQYGLIDRDANFEIKPEYNMIRTLGNKGLRSGKPLIPNGHISALNMPLPICLASGSRSLCIRIYPSSRTGLLPSRMVTILILSIQAANPRRAFHIWREVAPWSG